MLAGHYQTKRTKKGVIIMKFLKTGPGAAAAMITKLPCCAPPALANAMEQIPVIGSICKN